MSTNDRLSLSSFNRSLEKTAGNDLSAHPLILVSLESRTGLIHDDSSEFRNRRVEHEHRRYLCAEGSFKLTGRVPVEHRLVESHTVHVVLTV